MNRGIALYENIITDILVKQGYRLYYYRNCYFSSTTAISSAVRP